MWKQIWLVAVLVGGLQAEVYQFCLLKTGPKAAEVTGEAAKALQAAHMGHIQAMWKGGTLESAGPVGESPGLQGIYLFRGDEAAARKLAGEDPKVKAGTLVVDCERLEAPAGIGAAYREAFGKPGFSEKYVRRVVAIVPGSAGWGEFRPVIEGRMGARRWAVLETEDVKAAKAKLGEGIFFLWMHDGQVWPQARQ